MCSFGTVWVDESRDQSGVQLSILLVPGPESPAPESWILPGGHLSFPSEGNAEAPWTYGECYFFEYNRTPDLAKASATLLLEAQELLAVLQELTTRRKRSLLIISHGLGGYITKKALLLARAHFTSREVLRLVHGLVFLGCPHKLGRDALTEKLSQIFQLVSATRTKPSIERGLPSLISVAEGFSEALLSIPIVSVYERLPTELPTRYRSFLARPRKETLVGEALAKTGYGDIEVLIGADCNHNNLCDLRKIPSFLDAMRFLHTVFGTTSTPLAAENASNWTDVLRATPQVPDESSLSISISSQRSSLAPILDKFELPQKKALLPCFMVEGRARNRDFCGRREVLQQLDQKLLPSRGAPAGQRHVAIFGKPGEGKTAIANEFVFTRRNEFDAVFWIRAESEAKLKQGYLANIAHALHLQSQTTGGEVSTESREIAKAWLMNAVKEGYADAENANWLLVLDNCNDVDLVNDLWEVLEFGSVLMTSTDPKSAMALSDNQLSINLKGFTESQSIEVSEAKAIAQQLGGWALALRQMACLIRYEHLSLGEFKQRYDSLEERTELQQREAHGPSELYPFTVASILAKDAISMRSLALLEVCSMLDPDTIHEELFASTQQMSEVLSEFPIYRKGTYYADRAEIIKLSLVGVDPDTNVWTIHRMVQEAIRGQLTLGRFRATFGFATKLVCNAWGLEKPAEQRHSVKLWAHRSKWFPHILRLQELYQSYAGTEYIQPSRELAQILSEGGTYQHEISMLQVAGVMLRAAKSVFESLPETEVQDVQAMDILSDIYYGLGAWANETNHGEECLTFNKSLVALRCDLLKRGEPLNLRTAMAYNQRGTGHMMMKNYPSAIEDFTSSRALFKTLKLDVKCADSIPTVNLAVAHWLTGDFITANDLLEEGLAAREAAFGKNDTDSFRTGRFLHTLGNLRYDQSAASSDPTERIRLMDESYHYHQRALSQYQATIGIHHHRTADVCHRIAEHCIQRKSYDQARQFLEQAFRIWHVDEASFRNEISRTKFLKALLEDRVGNSFEAEALRRQAVELRGVILRDKQQEDRKSAAELEARDFDEIVTFWSR
ncbi:hypothetical protein AC578_950 [Pseudocercospora eumusae]|uniref:DUF7779 domain-containing protein n=1 Tax=Pseudocercospora eumusae TaxID=321146 RepID=A0A139HED4_9PEZI|nr:hypothetical protein AC578_950 [Pseudocercospora eumusae]